VSKTAAHYWLKESGGLRPRATRPASPLRLSLAEREEISRGLARGLTLTQIALQLGRSTSTVTREVKRNSGLRGYRAVQADRMARARMRRPREPKLAPRAAARPGRAGARAAVVTAADQLPAPRRVPRRLLDAGPGRDDLHVAVCAGQAGSTRGADGAPADGAGAASSPAAGHRATGADPGPAADLPAPYRGPGPAVPGHWEGDLVVGRRNQSYVCTLVERSSRYLLLLPVRDGRTDTVVAALAAAMARLPAQLCRSLTWDRGIEMTRHATFTAATGIPRVLRRRAMPVAAGDQREHQRAAAAVPASRTRPRRLPSRGAANHRGRAQQPAAKDARVENSNRGPNRARCVDRLRPPSPWGQFSSVVDMSRAVSTSQLLPALA
jgi:IS30 family transposase